MSAPQPIYVRPTWCESWCTRPHSVVASAAELCESEPVTLGPVRLEEASEDSLIEVSAEVFHDFGRATSIRDVSVRVGMEAISIPPATATAWGLALIQAAALHTVTAEAVAR